jgi:hypothetical protein
VRGIRLLHGRQGEEIGFEIQEVALRHSGKRRIGKDRKVLLTLWPHAPGHGAEKIGVAPLANPSFHISRNVGAVYGTEGSFNGSPASHERAFIRRIGMATTPPGSMKNILATLDHG